jgi:hypothetical protein
MILPREHGAWAMIVVPVALGALAGRPRWLHLALLCGVALGYMASYPALQALRRGSARPGELRWSAIYALAAAAAWAPVLVEMPRLAWLGVALAPPLISAAIFARSRRDRDLLNGLLGVAGLVLGGLAAAVLARGRYDGVGWQVYGSCLLYFWGSVLFVKSMVRRRGDSRFRWISWGYHLAALGTVTAAWSPWIGAALAPSLLRALLCWGKGLRPRQLGLIEIGNTLLFLALCALYFSPR